MKKEMRERFLECAAIIVKCGKIGIINPKSVT